MNNQIESWLEVVSVNEVKENKQSIITKYFTETELKEINANRPQTLAGFYAVKIALKKIINQKYPGSNITENNIILMHNSNGAPYIKDILSLQKEDLKKFCISISHTSENAYGFVAFGDR